MGAGALAPFVARASATMIFTMFGPHTLRVNGFEDVYAHQTVFCKWQTRACDISLLWRQNGHDGVSNHQPHDCLLNRPCTRRSKKTSKLRVTGLCAGNSPWISEFPAQMASNAENVSLCWRHHVASFRVLKSGITFRNYDGTSSSVSNAHFLIYMVKCRKASKDISRQVSLILSSIPHLGTFFKFQILND